MKRRIAKKLAKRLGLPSGGEVLPGPRPSAVVLPAPVPCPPPIVARLLVPPSYVGWVLITTPTGRRKVRWLAEDDHVYRDDQCREPAHPFPVQIHATRCRIEPCQVLVASTVRVQQL